MCFLRLTFRCLMSAIDPSKNIAPWWDAYRQLFLRNTPPSLQELFSLPVACPSLRHPCEISMLIESLFRSGGRQHCQQNAR